MKKETMKSYSVEGGTCVFQSSNIVLPSLDEVFGSTMCVYSTIENKLATLYENQVKIYAALQILIDRTHK